MVNFFFINYLSFVIFLIKNCYFNIYIYFKECQGANRTNITPLCECKAGYTDKGENIDCESNIYKYYQKKYFFNSKTLIISKWEWK